MAEAASTTNGRIRPSRRKSKKNTSLSKSMKEKANTLDLTFTITKNDQLPEETMVDEPADRDKAKFLSDVLQTDEKPKELNIIQITNQKWELRISFETRDKYDVKKLHRLTPPKFICFGSKTDGTFDYKGQLRSSNSRNGVLFRINITKQMELTAHQKPTVLAILNRDGHAIQTDLMDERYGNGQNVPPNLRGVNKGPWIFYAFDMGPSFEYENFKNPFVVPNAKGNYVKIYPKRVESTKNYIERMKLCGKTEEEIEDLLLVRETENMARDLTRRQKMDGVETEERRMEEEIKRITETKYQAQPTVNEEKLNEAVDEANERYLQRKNLIQAKKQKMKENEALARKLEDELKISQPNGPWREKNIPEAIRNQLVPLLWSHKTHLEDEVRGIEKLLAIDGKNADDSKVKEDTSDSDSESDDEDEEVVDELKSFEDPSLLTGEAEEINDGIVYTDKPATEKKPELLLEDDPFGIGYYTDLRSGTYRTLKTLTVKEKLMDDNTKKVGNSNITFTPQYYDTVRGTLQFIIVNRNYEKKPTGTSIHDVRAVTYFLGPRCERLSRDKVKAMKWEKIVAVWDELIDWSRIQEGDVKSAIPIFFLMCLINDEPNPWPNDCFLFGRYITPYSKGDGKWSLLKKCEQDITSTPRQNVKRNNPDGSPLEDPNLKKKQYVNNPQNGTGP